MAVHSPTSAEDVVAIVADAAAAGGTLEIVGGGSKAEIGAPARTGDRIDLRGLSGIVDYDPAELVLTVRAGTPLADIEALVAGEGQMLAFDPFDHGPIFGGPAGASTIGGVLAAGVGGSRRVSAGGARDHLLGFTAVSGRGERFVAGAKVVKNVTGYDLPKLACNSWGRLFALTEVTLKVLPRPRETATRLLRGLSAEQALRAMATAMGAQAEVAAAAHRPADGVTAFRLEGFGPSVAARLGLLDRLMADFGQTAPAGVEEADAFWGDMRTLAPLGDGTLWRISVPLLGVRALVAALEAAGARLLIDWAGALLWAAIEGEASMVRDAAAAVGAHAILVRGSEGERAATPAFQPQPPVLAALETRVRRAFDPAGVFETGRFA
ncbi:FAD-binding protein [Sphingomonas naphthae]|uniref:FAD-binding protein n=1 Tax=Sphingomonas naphthae TaxID=1813468 RepID=A0ABY7TGV9_9SPHN|nr:FAD-binding protein [Sphingomonas naphthae]WCT72466.1 FAD-binding protein [Sphingomonas naphthae]